ncbi:MAG: OmpA family protein [Oligoflexales bacterium]
MLGINRKTLLVLFLAVSGLTFYGCEETPPAEEPVQTDEQAQEIPADPGMDSMDSQASYSPETIFFAFDSDVISMEGQNKLSALAESLKGNSTSLQVAGHCDERGSTQYNLALGERRAQSVKQYLVQLGVEDSRITTISYGEEMPAVEGHDESAWSQNRRAEFTMQ